MKKAVVVATKPEDSILEYQIVEDSTGQILSHGHQVSFSLASLTTGQKTDLLAVRSLMAGMAAAGATALGRKGWPVRVISTFPQTDRAVFEIQDPATGEWLQQSVQIPDEIGKLQGADKAKVAAGKVAINTLVLTDATAKGLLT